MAGLVILRDHSSHFTCELAIESATNPAYSCCALPRSHSVPSRLCRTNAASLDAYGTCRGPVVRVSQPAYSRVRTPPVDGSDTKIVRKPGQTTLTAVNPCGNVILVV